MAEERVEAVNQLAVLAGGQEIQVNLIDGTKEWVTVRRVAIRHMQRYAATLSDEAEELKLYLGWTVEQIDRLTPDAWNDVMEAGRAANFPYLEAWRKRQDQALSLTAKLRGSIETTLGEKGMKMFVEAMAASAASQQVKATK